MKPSGNKLEETQSRLKTEAETADRGEISAERDSPPQLAALTTSLSPARLSGMSGGSRLQVGLAARTHYNGLISRSRLPSLFFVCWHRRTAKAEKNHISGKPTPNQHTSLAWNVKGRIRGKENVYPGQRVCVHHIYTHRNQFPDMISSLVIVESDRICTQWL